MGAELLAPCAPDGGLPTQLGVVADLNGWYGIRDAAWDTYFVSSHQSGHPLAWNRSHCAAEGAGQSRERCIAVHQAQLLKDSTLTSSSKGSACAADV